MGDYLNQQIMLLTYTYSVFFSTCSPDVALNWAGFRCLTRFAGEHMRQRKFAFIQRHSADFHVTGCWNWSDVLVLVEHFSFGDFFPVTVFNSIHIDSEFLKQPLESFSIFWIEFILAVLMCSLQSLSLGLLEPGIC